MREDNREKSETLLAGITAQSDFLRDGAARALHASAKDLPLRVPSRIYLVGCGDSHYAGLATRFAFERWSGIPTEALEALEFSRYTVTDAPSDALVVAVSGSGQALRTVECARVAGARGITTVGLTNNVESQLAHAATMLLPSTDQALGIAPGKSPPMGASRFELTSYGASVIGLYVLAVRLGEINVRLDAGSASRTLEALAAVGDDIARTIEASREAVSRVAAELPTDGLISVLGAGPSYAAALLGVAKFVEAAAYPAAGLQLEEWAHEQLFCTGPGTATLVVAPPGASNDRAREILRAVRDVGGYAVAICSVDDADTSALANAVLPIIAPADELLSPLVTVVPLELTALEFTDRLGLRVVALDDQKRRVTDLRQNLVYSSHDEASTEAILP